MTTARMLALCVFALTAILSAGCEKRPTALNRVSGKIHCQGLPLPGGIIVFSPDASRGESGKIAYGKILADGSYALLTGEAEGVGAGWYRVTIAALSGTTSSLDAPPVSLVNEKYRDPLLSQLQCEVKANQDNHLDFNLD